MGLHRIPAKKHPYGALAESAAACGISLELGRNRFAGMELMEDIVQPANELHIQIELVHGEQSAGGSQQDGEKLLQQFHVIVSLLLGETLLASVLGSTQSAHQLRVGLQLNDFELQHVLDGLLQARVLRAAARQRDAVGGAGLLGHDEAALGNGHLDAGSDLVGRLAFAHEGDDFGLRENGALGRDRDDVLRRQGQVRELRQAHLERAGHGLEEAAGTGGALIVHREALDRAVGVDADALHVLAADIDDGADFRIRDVHAHGVAGDLGDVLVSERDLVAAVAGADQVSELLGVLQADLIADFLHGSDRGLLRIDLAANRRVGAHFAVLVENNCLRVGGTYVASAKIFHSITSS